MRILIWILPLIAAGGLWLGMSLAPGPSITIILGQEGHINAYGEGQNLYNFLGWGQPETLNERSARRAGPHASFVIPYAFRLGQPLHVRMITCGCGVTETFRLTVNTTIVDLPSGDEWRLAQILVPDRPSLHGPDLYLKWQSDGTLGPLVHRVALAPQHVHGTTTPLLLVLIVGGVLLVARAWQLWALLLWVITIITTTLVSWVFVAPHLLPWNALVVIGGGAALLLTWRCHNHAHRFLLWLMVVWVLAAPQILGAWVLDDAFISFRYAQNLVHGHGLTFNPGGERVEGYTNFLWVLLIAAALFIGVEPVLAAHLLSLVLAITLLLLTYTIAQRLFCDQIGVLLTPLLLVLNPAFLLYTARGSGMETALVTLLVLLTCWLAWIAQTRREAFIAGMMGALAAMTRPDAGLVVVAVLLSIGIATQWAGRRKSHACAWGSAFATEIPRPFIIGCGMLYTPYFLWRWHYYGYLLPNTFYAKTGATIAQVERGLHYAWECWWAHGGIILALLLLLSLVRLYRGERAWSFLLLLWIISMLNVLFAVAVGGDHFPLGRFFIPILPPITLLAVAGLSIGQQPSECIQESTGRVMAAALLGVILAVQLPASDSRIADSPIWQEHKVALKNSEYGHWLREHTPPSTVIATGIAGTLPYYAERTVIDALGLNDTYIAHRQVPTMGRGIAGAEKTDIPYILGQHPDYIPMSSAGIFWDDEQFQRAYETIEVEGPRGGTLTFFRRTPPYHNQF